MPYASHTKFSVSEGFCGWKQHID